MPVGGGIPHTWRTGTGQGDDALARCNYAVGSPASASVAVNDDDAVPRPGPGPASPNAPPVFPSGATAQTAAVGAAFAYTVPAASDPDDDSLTYAATLADDGALPGWLTFTASTRSFSGMPCAGDAPAELSVQVTATDDGSPALSATTIFVLTVADLRPALLRVAVERVLAVVARRSLTSALENIGSRFSASAVASGLTLTGRAVPLQGAGLAADGTGGCVAGGFERHGLAAGGLAQCGLLTPFAEAVLAGGDDRRLRLGARLEAKHGDLGAELSGERSEGAEHALRLRFDLRF